jgi:GT2 family glycosyltransferase
MTDLNKFYTCSLFSKKIENYDNFSFFQNEIKLVNQLDLTRFKSEEIKYDCKFYKNEEIDINKPLLLIPTKDNIQLIEYTLKNLISFEVNKHANIIVIDDRSEIQHQDLCKKNNINCLRVDNKKGFNFSMLINIGIKIGIDLGIKHIILWNNDMWTDSKDTLPLLLEKHISNQNTISGTKLVYPPFKWDGKDEREDIQKMFGLSKTHRGTVQFGGSNMLFNNQLNNYMIGHRCRFFSPLDRRCNVDKTDIFLTGAFLIINIDWLIKTGGLNPSLSKAYQDVDLCFKAVKDGEKIMYFGKDLYFFHDESLSQTKDKFDLQFLSDNTLMYKIWNRMEFEKYLLGMTNE